MTATLLGSVVHGFDNATNTVTSPNHTLLAGNNRVVLVGIVGGNAAARTVSAITYGGQAMTEIFYDHVSGNSGHFVGLYELREGSLPGDGVRTATVTMSDDCADLGIIVLSIQDASQSGAEDVDSSHTSGVGSTLTLSISNGSFQFDVVSKASDGESGVPGANQTERWDGDIGNRRALSSTASVEATMSWTWNNRFFYHAAASWTVDEGFIPRASMF